MYPESFLLFCFQFSLIACMMSCWFLSVECAHKLENIEIFYTLCSRFYLQQLYCVQHMMCGVYCNRQGLHTVTSTLFDNVMKSSSRVKKDVIEIKSGVLSSTRQFRLWRVPTAVDILEYCEYRCLRFPVKQSSHAYCSPYLLNREDICCLTA